MSQVRLDSWKEIAAYLNRDVRTVQRWEKQEGLPVHRHLHDERSSAFAFTNEIDDWLKNRAGQGDAEKLPVTGPVTPPVSRKPLAWWPAAAALAAVASGVVIWAIFMRPPPVATPPSILSIVFGPSERFREWGPDIALSPDGSTLAYVGDGSRGPRGELRVRHIGQLESRVLEGAFGVAPFFSPDGRWIGFHNAEQFMKVSIDGGTPVPLGITTGFLGTADWGVDNFIVYAGFTPQGTHGLYRIAAGGGTPQPIAALDGNAGDAYWLTPQSIDNGRVILCTVSRTVSTGSRFQVVAVSVATGERRIVVDDAKHGLYLGDGVLVYQRKNGLFATHFDVDRREAIGPQVTVQDNVSERERRRSWTHANGTLVYWPSSRVARRLVWVDRFGKEEPLPLPPAMYQSPRVSPDGKRLAYSILQSAEVGDVWVHDLGTGASSQLTTDGRSGTPMWTPDGDAIVYSTARASGRELMRLGLGIGATPELIRAPSGFLWGGIAEPASWADGGRTLLVSQSSIVEQPQIWSVDLHGEREHRSVFPREMKTGIHVRVSPNGRWMAYAAGGLPIDVFVAPAQGGPPFRKVSTAGGGLPVWSTSGRELFYRSGVRLMAVSVTPDGTPGEPRVLFEGRYLEAEPGGPNYDVAHDDQRFLMVLPGDTHGPDRLHLAQGWKADVIRRLDGAR